jgi:hypothetical protein
MKESIARLFDCPVEWIDHFKLRGEVVLHIPYSQGKGNGVEVALTGREFLQRYGTESHRDLFGQYFWVDQLLPNPTWINKAYGEGKGTNWRNNFDGAELGLIADLRFQSEAERVRELGGQVWRVDRPGIESDGHASEILLDGEFIDYSLVNNGSLEHLRELVHGLLSLAYPQPV